VQDESEKVEEPQKRSMLWRHKKSVSWLTFWVEEDFLDSWGGEGLKKNACVDRSYIYEKEDTELRGLEVKR
jgi:hypothetical protein